jgi:signal transduction histidine kinase
MNQVASAVSRTLDLDQVLGEILQNVLAITEFDSGLISYVDPDTDQLVLAVHHNLPPVMVEKLIAKGMGGTACDLVFQTGKTVHVPDFERIPGEVLQLAELLNESWPHEGVAPVFIGPKAMGFQAYLGAPLTAKGSQLGTVCVFNKTPRVASSGRIALTQAIGQQVGVAVVNARLYAEQLRTVERLRELDSMKSAFLANMSHELRTPLNSILGFAQVIIEGLDGPLTETMAADLDLIEKNGKHLLHLINDVLDLARIEAGRLSLNPEPTSIYNLLEDVMQSNAPLVREKSLDLRLIADPDCDWTAEVDQIRMRQICINLIGNGVKFTENGGIYIELEKLYAVPERGSNLIQVRIRDTGIGIPQDKLEEIFEAFSQVDASTTRKVGGTGLGLPISRRLVEMHGGRLWAESEGIGKGSTFYLDLPVVQQQT